MKLAYNDQIDHHSFTYHEHIGRADEKFSKLLTFERVDFIHFHSTVDITQHRGSRGQQYHPRLASYDVSSPAPSTTGSAIRRASYDVGPWSSQSGDGINSRRSFHGISRRSYPDGVSFQSTAWIDPGSA